jgi:glucan-binding YG repeat protein
MVIRKMWKDIKRVAAVCCFCMIVVMVLGGRMETYGAESSVIESVTVTFKTTFGDQGEIPDPVVTVGNGCSLVDIQYNTSYDKWKPGKKVRAEITIEAENGKLFPASLNRSQCKVTGADFVSARALGDSQLQVKVDYRPVSVLGNTGNAGWSNSHANRAVWEPVPYAPGYSLVLYGDNKSVKRMTVQTNYADLNEYIKDDGKTYYYEVKAIPVSSEDKKYLKEGDFISSTEQELNWEEIDARDGGELKGNNYVMPNGNKEVNSWKKISDRWYYFDQNGNMVKGWLFKDGYWYYMDQSGVMKTGWLDLSSEWRFYLSPTGEMQIGWVQLGPGVWYYMNQDGYMQRGWIFVDNQWHYMGTDGKMQFGWVQVGDKQYYLNGDGTMAANTVVDGRYLGPDGAAQ